MPKFNSRALTILLALVAVGCNSARPPAKSITVAAGTTLVDSGLFDELLPQFKAESGIEVRVVAVGTGQALELAKRGDADALVTHSPAAEKQFVADGWAESRAEVFWNDFVIVGPKSDPAGVAAAKDAVEALQKLAQASGPFVSRGDDSGTHKLELKLWKEAGLAPVGEWYASVGAGMAHTLRVTTERQAYTLTDRGTWLAHQKQLDLAVLYEGDPRLINQYAVLVVSPAKHPHLHAAEARRFAEFLASHATQQVVAAFGQEQYGQPLFHTGAARNGAESPE